MEWSPRASWVCDCAKATMIGQFVGCSFGCSDCHAWETSQWDIAPDAGRRHGAVGGLSFAFRTARRNPSPDEALLSGDR